MLFDQDRLLLTVKCKLNVIHDKNMFHLPRGTCLSTRGHVPILSAGAISSSAPSDIETNHKGFSSHDTSLNRKAND